MTLIIWMWPTGGPGAEGLTAPWWGTVKDLLPDGPDAGEWARNIATLADGKYEEMDHHRMPSWMLMVTWVMALVPDDGVVVAGHLTNRLLYLIMGLSTYLLGRMGGGQLVGLAAATLVITNGNALENSQRFGIDIALMALLPLTLALALVAIRRWPLALFSGLISGFLMGLHYTALPYVLPALVVILLKTPGWGRLGGAALHIIGLTISARLLMEVYPVPSVEVFASDILNAIAPQAQRSEQFGAADEALAIAKAGLGDAMNGSVRQLLNGARPAGVPWTLALLLPWFGAVGLGMQKPPNDPTRPWWKTLWASSDPVVGLGLLLCLSPLFVLNATTDMERYGDNLAGFGAVLVMRGLIGPLFLLEGAARLKAPMDVSRIPAASLTAAVIGVISLYTIIQHRHIRVSLPPDPNILDQIAIGEAIKATFEPGTGVNSPSRESLFHAGMVLCPERICPEGATEEHYIQCLEIHAQLCRSEVIGYVATESTAFYDPNAIHRRSMDAWLAELWEPAVTLDRTGGRVDIYSFTREDIAALRVESTP